MAKVNKAAAAAPAVPRKRRPLVRFFRVQAARDYAAAHGVTFLAALEKAAGVSDIEIADAITRVGVSAPGDGSLLDSLTKLLDWIIANQDKIKAVIDMIISLFA